MSLLQRFKIIKKYKLTAVVILILLIILLNNTVEAGIYYEIGNIFSYVNLYICWDTEKILTCYNKALYFKPDFAPVLFKKACILYVYPECFDEDGYNECLDKIIKISPDLKGISINKKNEFDYTPLEFAVEIGHKEFTSLLLSKGADVNVKSKYELTLLAKAVRNGNKDIVDLLIKNGADVNLKDNNYRTPLIHAIECQLTQGTKKDKIEIVKLLINHGASINIKAGYYGTPLDYAMTSCDEEVIMLLLEEGGESK